MSMPVDEAERTRLLAALYRDCPAEYHAQADGAIPRCLRSDGHPNAHVSLYENCAIFWNTGEDGTITDCGTGAQYIHEA